jgi:hypothetical protein
MALKILKVIWFCSFLVVLGSFMYVYAGLPEKVVVNEQTEAVILSRDTLFYTVLAVIAIANALVFVVSRIFPQQDENFKAWFYGLIACANLFFVVGLNFISLYNSNEKYDFERLGPIIYGSIGLVIVWAAAWPVYRIAQKIVAKQPA